MTSNSGNKASSANTYLNIDVKIDWFVKTVREIKDETTCKKEIKMMSKEVVRKEILM